MVDFVAVYGSLRRGMQAECKMQRLEFVGVDYLDASLYALGWYPGIKLNTGFGVGTVVEVYKLPKDERLREAILFDLDGYEGYSPDAPANSLFVRKVVETLGDRLKVYAYEYNYPVNRAPLVENGDWVIFRQGDENNALRNQTA